MTQRYSEVLIRSHTRSVYFELPIGVLLFSKTCFYTLNYVLHVHFVCQIQELIAVLCQHLILAQAIAFDRDSDFRVRFSPTEAHTSLSSKHDGPHQHDLHTSKQVWHAVCTFSGTFSVSDSPEHKMQSAGQHTTTARTLRCVSHFAY